MKNFLLVDDSLDWIETIESFIENIAEDLDFTDYKIVRAFNAHEALRRLEELDTVAMVFLDSEMKFNANGIDFLNGLNAMIDKNPAIKESKAQLILLNSAYTEKNKDLLATGLISEVLQKNGDYIYDRLETLLSEINIKAA